MSGRNGQFFEFDRFRLNAANPGLWRGDELIALPPKALELLILLVGRHGEIVSREEVLEAVWRDTFVEEANINYTVSLLRKTLDSNDKARFIQTVPKRGYRFVADVREVRENGDAEFYNPTEPAPNPPKARVRWHFIGIILLGIFFLTSFAMWWRMTDQTIPVTHRNIKTVAILPFKSLDEKEQNRALSLGLTDSLISRFGSLNRFTVRPLDAVEKYAQTEKDALKFGEELKVDAVLAGTFQAVDNRLRVSVRLLDVRDGAQIWHGSFDETEADIFILQDKLSAQVANTLLASLTRQDERILRRRHTENTEAFRAYARGREIHDKRKAGWFEKAVAEYQKAIELDPAFSLAYTGFADVFVSRGNLLSDAESLEYYKKAKFYAEKAIELDAESAESHTSLGGIKLSYEWNWLEAEKHFTRSLELNPNYIKTYQRYAQLLSILGRHDEALAAIKKASEINPLSQAILMMHFPILESRGDMDEALKLAEEFYLFDQRNEFAGIAYGTFLFHKGNYARVIELGEENLAKEKNSVKGDSLKHKWLSLLITSYEKNGQPDKAARHLKRLEELARDDSKALYSLAMNYAELGRREETISALQKCFERHEERMMWVKNEPRLAHLRDDSRFQEILRAMNLAG